MSKEKNTSNGIGFFGLLGIVFIVLKLTGCIDWSWWWVTLPLWGGAAIVLFIFVIIVAVVWAINFYENKEYKKIETPRKSNFQKRLEELEKSKK